MPIDVFGGGAPPTGGVDTVYAVTNGAATTRHCTNFPRSTCAYRLVALLDEQPQLEHESVRGGR